MSIGQIQDRPCAAMKGPIFWVWIILLCCGFLTVYIKFSLLLAETIRPKRIDEINGHMLGVLAGTVAERAFCIWFKSLRVGYCFVGMVQVGKPELDK